MRSQKAPLHVTVLGGGPAAAELLLALRALAEDRVTLELVTADLKLRVRAASPAAAFGEGTVAVYDVAEIAAEVGARLRVDRAEAVASRARRIRLASAATVSYDALVVAVGARARIGVAGARTFRDQRDAAVLAQLLDDLAAGTVRRVAFAAPAGVAWTVPLYELALLTAAEVARLDLDVDITLVTPEHRGVEVFGDRASEFVEQLLDSRGVRLLTNTAVTAVHRDGMRLRDGSRWRADRVVAVPRLVGRRLAGIPADWNAFIPADPWGRVVGLPDVFVAGDARAFPVKQGGVATQQADAIASLLAAQAGVAIPLTQPRHVLRTRLVGADRPVYLRAQLDGDGRPVDAASEVVLDEPPWWPAAKLVGRWLTPWMAAQTDRAQTAVSAAAAGPPEPS